MLEFEGERRMAVHLLVDTEMSAEDSSVGDKLPWMKRKQLYGISDQWPLHQIIFAKWQLFFCNSRLIQII